LYIYGSPEVEESIIMSSSDFWADHLEQFSVTAAYCVGHRASCLFSKHV
jgi:hypothetical protein